MKQGENFMIKNRGKMAFTLAEALITMVIVGVIAILVVPGMIKDINNKSRMAMLKSVVVSLDSAVANELTRSRTTSIESTAIALNPQSFLDNLEKINGDTFASAYTNYSGSEATVDVPDASVHLKNGASVGIINDSDNKKSFLIVDVNGLEDPNIIGVDYYILELAWSDNFDKGIHVGDLGGYETDKTEEELKTACLDGDGKACYKLAEISGFEPNYLTN